MLEIKNLHATVGEKEILNGISLTLEAGRGARHHGAQRLGQEHARQVLAGHPAYEVTEGTVLSRGQGPARPWSPKSEPGEGVFLAFQYPVEIPGRHQRVLPAGGATTRSASSRAAGAGRRWTSSSSSRRRSRSWTWRDEIMSRAVNEGFSGGEKKRNEIFQMAVLEPKLAILDETDSGLDIDALRIVADGVNTLRRPGARDPCRHALPAPAQLHRPGLGARLADGRIAKSGGKELASSSRREGTTGSRKRRRSRDRVVPLSVRGTGGQRGERGAAVASAAPSSGHGSIRQCGFPGARTRSGGSRQSPDCAGPLSAPAVPAALTRDALQPFLFGHPEWPQLVFVNGDSLRRCRHSEAAGRGPAR